jgi:hypothetical protein
MSLADIPADWLPLLRAAPPLTVQTFGPATAAPADPFETAAASVEIATFDFILSFRGFSCPRAIEIRCVMPRRRQPGGGPHPVERKGSLARYLCARGSVAACQQQYTDPQVPSRRIGERRWGAGHSIERPRTKESTFSEESQAAVPFRAEMSAGMPDGCRKQRISGAAAFDQKARQRGMEVSRLRQRKGCAEVDANAKPLREEVFAADNGSVTLPDLPRLSRVIVARQKLAIKGAPARTRNCG